MIATLPMYDRAETEAASNRLWALVRDALGYGPRRLTRDGDFHWTDPDLVLSQTCGLPFRTYLRDKVTLVATPVHDLPCPPGGYFSVLVARKDDARLSLRDFAGARVAANGSDSQSGWAALGAVAHKEGIDFREVTFTGAHRESACAIATGQADLAAIDAVSWKMISRWDRFADGLKVFGQTPPTPALPFITAPGTDPAPIRRALARAIDALTATDREALCLSGVAMIRAETYFALPLHEPSCLSD